MMQTLSARPTHAHRNPRIAIAACALLVALLVLLAGAERAMARPAPTLPAPAPVAAAGPVTAPATAPATAPGQEAMVEIPSINVSLPVVRGGQDVIDRGVAAHYEGTQWRPPTGPGRPGTYWLAAHNSTQGSPFENLPAIAVGAEIRIISPDGTVFTYEVTARDRVGTTTTFETVYGQDASAKRILLQTCEGAARRLLVHGTLTSVTSD
jgi:LPXTG-site transpeptidase (sortase) family protein